MAVTLVSQSSSVLVWYWESAWSAGVQTRRPCQHCTGDWDILCHGNTEETCTEVGLESGQLLGLSLGGCFGGLTITSVLTLDICIAR